MRARVTNRKITANTHRVILETLLEIIARREKQLRGKLTVLDQQQQALISEQQVCQTRALAVNARLKELTDWQGTLSCHLLLDKKLQMARLFTQAQSFLTQRQQLDNQYQQLVSQQSKLQENVNALMKRKEKITMVLNDAYYQS
ncbi:secretion system apparatus SsaO [Salmonella enterica subsp. arizonae]|uniref:Secretion system apparatus SsaO n=1 Tax=Salmonella enterica subsp. arizonae TaxID=59203 RepID=A0A379SI18_SALER|nr:secretion system apparatus SsaO [Salmonella enterica subsp. arizonae]